MKPISVSRVAEAAFLFLLLSLPVAEAVAANEADEISDLKRAIQQLQSQNRELMKRLETLESETPKRHQAVRTAAPKSNHIERAQRTAPESTQAELAQREARTEAPRKAEAPPPVQPPAQPSGQSSGSATAENGNLERRVHDLEVTKTAQEDAIRSIIRGSLSGLGPRINEFVTLGGSLETTVEHSSDFSGGKPTDAVTLSTAELDFEIKANDWVVGNMTLSYDNGTSVLFPTTPSFNTGVDRITLDKAYVTVGDTQRFPIFAKAGLDYLEFGVSTGVHRADVLSIVNPLTIEAFEMRKPAVGIGFAFPTPALGPAPPPIIVPPVRPLVINPLIASAAGLLGYRPLPLRPKPPTPYTYPPEQPPFYGIINFYDSSTPDIPNRNFGSNINARLGYRTGGHCGRSYSELKGSFVCPWSIDVNVDYDTSVFDSRFLQSEYQSFLSQIGTVPGMAATMRLMFGPFMLVGEWNGALRQARFVDGTGRNVHITPGAWQVALGYQFDWNPWVETIGAQGDYVALAYSRSYDLAGVTQVSGTTQTRVGFLPESRVTATVGEWVLENTRLAIEYSHNWDYPVSKGGTGRQADGVFAALTYNW